MRAEAFVELYERHAQNLFGFLAYRTGDRALAEDMVADTFERAFRARGRFDPGKATEKTWLYSIALNCLRDHQRRSVSGDEAVRRTAAEMEGVRADALESTLTRLDVMEALDGLSSDEREAVALRFGAQLSVPEIARVTRQSLTTAEGRVYRAIRKLRGAMGPSRE